MKLKRASIGCALLQFMAILILSVVFAGKVSAASYSDVGGHWASSTIEKWSDVGVISGYPDGTFKPDKNVTRAELSEILYKLYGRHEPACYFSHPEIDESAWYHDSVLSMEAYGITLANGTTLVPDETLTREEAMYMIAKTMNSAGGEDDLQGSYRHTLQTRFGITDEDDISDRFYRAVSELATHNYVTGYPDKTFRPKAAITRAEVLTIISRMVGAIISEPGEYNVETADRVFVSSSDVTLHVTDSTAGRYSGIYVFLTGDATSPSTVKINYGGSLSKITAFAFDFTNGKCKCITDDNVNVTQMRIDYDTKFATGHGTALFPYMIATPEQLKLLAEEKDESYARYVDSPSYFELACDIDMGTITEPIARDDGGFLYAILNGADHTVKYDMIGNVSGSFLGLFDGFSIDSRCKNLKVSGNVDITVNGDAEGSAVFGGIAGYAHILENCSSDMTIHIKAGKNLKVLSAGGLSGTLFRSAVSNCTSDAIMNVDCSAAPMCSTDAGGIAGDISFGKGMRSTIENCSSACRINVNGGLQITAGGILGAVITPENVIAYEGSSLASMPRIIRCASNADISASDASFQIDTGGISGQISCASVGECYAKPALKSSGSSLMNRGTICGACYEVGYIYDCIGDAAGVMIGDGAHVGGIAGRARGCSISRCCATSANALPLKDRIVCESWNEGTVDSCFDFTGKNADMIRAALQNDTWDFEKIWTFESGKLKLINCGDLSF